MKIFRKTKEHSEYWRTRVIDWKTSYLDTWNHPHRDYIVQFLKSISWLSLFEIGCGAGANLLKILKELPGRQLGGIDINPDAIELAQSTFKGGFFKVGSAEDIMMSDKSTDVVLSDMALIYVSRDKIDKYIEEIKRVARNYVLFCEFHSDSWLERLRIKATSGYSAYNYKKLLQKHGFYDIFIYKLPPEAWPGAKDQIRHLILAKLPPDV